MKRLAFAALWVVTGVLNAAAAASATGGALGAERARLLLTRVGFAPAADEVAVFAPLTQAEAVDRLLAEPAATARRPAPGGVEAPLVTPRELRAMNDEQRRALRREAVARSFELRGWWLMEMASSPTPVVERMTLFWHNHFVSAQPKVRNPQLLYQQNLLLRREALGNFARLLHAVAKDPAMLVYLDGASSRKSAPNENFAREVMELFTLGEGHYRESDIKEAARAFTGWSVDPETGRFLFRRGLHDDGRKTVLGRSGNFDGDAVLDILLAQPAASEFIVGKLWREFVAPRPDTARAQAIAAQFRASGYEIKVALRALFNQPELVTRDQDNALIKSPVELAIGLARQSGAEIVSPASLALAVAAMGQNLFSPPNVRGWPGGEAWINTQTLLARKQFIERALLTRQGAPVRLASVDEETLKAAVKAEAGSEAKAEIADAGSEAKAETKANVAGLPEAAGLLRRLAQLPSLRIDSASWLKRSGMHPERVADGPARERLEKELLVLPAVNGAYGGAQGRDMPAREADGRLGMDVLRALVLDPVYQLK